MLNLQRLEIFIAVVSAGSFTRAATSLGLTKAVVSFNVKQLEIAHSRLPLPMRWPVIRYRSGFLRPQPLWPTAPRRC